MGLFDESQNLNWFGFVKHDGHFVVGKPRLKVQFEAQFCRNIAIHTVSFFSLVKPNARTRAIIALSNNVYEYEPPV